MVDNAPTAAIPRIFKLDLIVPQEATDEFGHVSNQRYVAWMQEVATAHSAANGWPMKRYLEIGAAWVVRSHFIEYLRPAFAGDEIVIFTWAASLALREVSRRYLFRPKRVPEELLAKRRDLRDRSDSWSFV